MDKTKSYDISKHVVLEAFQRVKANKGAAGIDDESLETFEANLKNNLYKIMEPNVFRQLLSPAR